MLRSLRCHLGRSRLAVTLIAVGTSVALFAPVLASAAASDTLSVESVDTATWPKVTMRVVLPAGMLDGRPLTASDFSLTENGSRIRELDVSQVPVARRTLDVLLVMDTSGSMEGARLAEAKGAAQGFLKDLGAKDHVGVIAFSGRPSLVATLTTDRAVLTAAITGLTTEHRTALYDAVAAAAQSLASSDAGGRAIVLLSDGTDTDSGHTLSTVASELAATGVPVYAVVVGRDSAGTQALQTMARASGGRVISANGSGDLAATFSGIAHQLSSPYDVTFTSLRPPAKDLEFQLTASAGTGRASATLAVPNPDTASTAQQTTAVVPTPSGIWPIMITFLVFLAVGSLAAAVLFLGRPEPNAIEQLKYYEQLRGTGGRGVHSAQDIDPDSVRGRVVGLAGVVASKGGFEAPIRQALERAGLPLRPVEYMILHSATVLVVGALVQIIGHSVILTGMAVIVLALGPILALQVLADRRTAAFQEQLPDVLNLLASSLRAGWGLQQAVGVVVNELGPPAAPEFERVVTEARLGLPLEDALEKMAVRMESDDFRWAVTAIAIQREVGGNLAEVLDMVASTIRERASLRRQISSLTAEGRLSAYILIALPFVEAAALLMLNPNYFSNLVSTSYGLVTAAIGVVLLVIGIFWLRAVVRIEV